MTTSWGYPLRHPWYTSTMKRKRSSDDSSDDLRQYESAPFPVSGYAEPASIPALSTTPQTKRRRTSTLERGFAHLSLAPAVATVAAPHSPLLVAPIIETPPSDSHPAPSYDVDMVVPGPEVSEVPLTEHPASILASSVVEHDGTSPPVEPKEIKMKGTSWYEPEKDRIVITDLDGYDTDVEDFESADEYKQEVEQHPDAGEYADSNASLTVSSALLAHLKKTQTTSTLPFKPTSDTSHALVLFKPLPLPSLKDDDDSSVDTPHSTPSAGTVPIPLIQEDDAMDVEL